MARRRLIARRPPRVRMRALNPCVRARLRFLGWYVRFTGDLDLSVDRAVAGREVYGRLRGGPAGTPPGAIGQASRIFARFALRSSWRSLRRRYRLVADAASAPGLLSSRFPSGPSSGHRLRSRAPSHAHRHPRSLEADPLRVATGRSGRSLRPVAARPRAATGQRAPAGPGGAGPGGPVGGRPVWPRPAGHRGRRAGPGRRGGGGGQQPGAARRRARPRGAAHRGRAEPGLHVRPLRHRGGQPPGSRRSPGGRGAAGRCTRPICS